MKRKKLKRYFKKKNFFLQNFLKSQIQNNEKIYKKLLYLQEILKNMEKKKAFIKRKKIKFNVY